MTQRVPMTPEGHKILMEKLRHLKQVERAKNIEEIEVAREKGDLSENAEYDAAKEKQQQISQQIQELEHKLSLAQVIDPKTINSEKVAFGATVTIADINNDEEVSYLIVGTDESDISKKKISIESPIARALLGKMPGDEVKVNTPKGMREFEVVAIEYK